MTPLPEPSHGAPPSWRQRLAKATLSRRLAERRHPGGEASPHPPLSQRLAERHRPGGGPVAMPLGPRWPSPLAALATVLLLAGGILALWLNPYHLERDIVQERLDTAGAPLGPEHTLGQSFVSRRAGLRRIEFLAVVYDPSREFPPEARVCLDLERLVEPSAPPVAACLPLAGVAHNQTLAFDLPPQAGSRGAAYRLTLRSDRDVGLSVWLTDHEAYADGQAWEDGAPRAGDLYFRTWHSYHLTDTLGDLAVGLGRRAWPIAVTLVVLLVPGGVLLMLVLTGRREPVVALTLAAALSLAFWPLHLLWTTALGLRLGTLGAWLTIALLAAVAVAQVAWPRWAGARGRPYPRRARVGATGRSPLRRPERQRRTRAPAPPTPAADVAAPSPERRPERQRGILNRVAAIHARDPWPYVALAIVMLLVVATRALQVRDLVVPAWVDSVHHTKIVRLIADGGQVPASYRPYMPVDDFHYHFGFHAGAAALAWLSGLSSDQAVLLFGQALNVLAPLAAYTMAWWIGRSRWGGVGAALVVGALCYMPAYYVTWGRYTQLAGLTMLPPLVLATVWALSERRAGAGTPPSPAAGDGVSAGVEVPRYAQDDVGATGRSPSAGDGVSAGVKVPRWRSGRRKGDRPVALMGGQAGAGGLALLTAVLLAGLVLTHYRVLVFYALLVILQAALILWRAARAPSPRVRGEGWRARGARIGRALGGIAGRGALCGGLALFLALPWAVKFLVRVTPGFEAVYGGWAGGEGGNEFPGALLQAGWTRPLLYVAAAGALWGLARRRGEVVVTVAWVGLCLLAANLRLLGLADIWLITNSAIVIAFWLPVGALCGWLVGDLGRLLARARLPRLGLVGRQAVSALLMAAIVALGAVGSWRMVDIVNPITILATKEDMAAIAWARDHTPPKALFLINTGTWQKPMRYGTDAGWWLNLLADRRTTLPSLLYMMGGQTYFNEVNALGIAVEEAESVDDPALLERLRAAGVSHVFVGARGGHLLPRSLDPSPHYRTLYVHGPARIYQIVYP